MANGLIGIIMEKKGAKDFIKMVRRLGSKKTETYKKDEILKI